MSVQQWMHLWTFCLLGSIIAFGMMAVVVSVGGAIDVSRLLRGLREEAAETDVDQDAK